MPNYDEDDASKTNECKFQKDSRFEGLSERSSSRIQDGWDPKTIRRVELAARAWKRHQMKEEDCRNMTPMTSSSSSLPRMDQECMLDEYLKDFKDIPKLVPQDLCDKFIPISNAHTTHEVSQDLPEMENLPNIEKLHIKDGETDSLPSEFSKSCNLK
ncbi:uncharacterized protein LOC106659756 [Trichogramma pretiosum]|uniref:uncharacterized protein LOC106659756 n=1 Tax=Trichogramma pretiosum TaxID=7493 RepID=UPI0006C99B9C|nr:uncharacterized protein LOC106659756 [Trichogramma pretiosum]